VVKFLLSHGVHVRCSFTSFTEGGVVAQAKGKTSIDQPRLDVLRHLSVDDDLSNGRRCHDVIYHFVPSSKITSNVGFGFANVDIRLSCTVFRSTIVRGRKMGELSTSISSDDRRQSPRRDNWNSLNGASDFDVVLSAWMFADLTPRAIVEE
jgi:hypothetical protein